MFHTYCKNLYTPINNSGWNKRKDQSKSLTVAMLFLIVKFSIQSFIQLLCAAAPEQKALDRV